MQHGSVNCPQHGSAVSCSGMDGAQVLTGTCPYGEPVTMTPQALDGPFQRHWDPHNRLNAQPSPGFEESPAADDREIIDLSQLVRDVKSAHVKIDAVSDRLDALIEVIKAGQAVSATLKGAANAPTSPAGAR